MRKALVSLGNPIKSDDNIANVVLEKLKESSDLLLIRGGTNPEDFIPDLRRFKPDAIYFLDAVDFKSGPGDVRLFSLDNLEGASISSTHNAPLGLFSKMFPKTKIFVIGIQPKRLEVGDGLSKELRERIGEIAERVKELLG